MTVSGPGRELAGTGGAASASGQVVLLHGQPGGGSDWDSVVRRLPATFRVLALDRAGYRASPHPAGDFVANANVVLADMDEAGIDRAVIVGHSYGGGVALALAANHPERVQALALVSSVGPGCLTRWDALLAAPVAGPICALAAWWMTPPIVRVALDRLQRARRRPFEHHQYVNWDVWSNAHHRAGAMWRTFLTEQRALVAGLAELTAQLPAITAPTVVLADPADTLVPLATARALSEQLPNAQLWLVDQGGHHLPRRVPAAVAAAVTELAAL